MLDNEKVLVPAVGPPPVVVTDSPGFGAEVVVELTTDVAPAVVGDDADPAPPPLAPLQPQARAAMATTPTAANATPTAYHLHTAKCNHTI